MEVGLWAEVLNLVVRRFCGCDCTEMVQRESRCDFQTRDKLYVRRKRKRDSPKRIAFLKGQKICRFA